MKLLRSFVKIERELANVPAELRTNSALLSYLPAGAVVYGSVPNPGLTINRALALAEEQSAQNTAFAAWWNSETGRELKQMLDRIVFIGTTALGTREVVATPLDTLFAGVEVQATVADNLLQQDFIQRSLFGSTLESLTVLLIGVVLVLLVFLADWRTALISSIAIPLSLLAAGLLVAPEDRPGWLAAVRSILEDREHARRLASAARRRVEEEFALPVVVDRYLELYAQLLDRDLTP